MYWELVQLKFCAKCCGPTSDARILSELVRKSQHNHLICKLKRLMIQLSSRCSPQQHSSSLPESSAFAERFPVRSVVAMDVCDPRDSSSNVTRHTASHSATLQLVYLTVYIHRR